MWRDLICLCKESEQLDSLGKPYKTFTKRTAFCDERGVKRNEFYQASGQGYRPELCVVIRAVDYEREMHVEYRDRPYRVIRTYPVANECLELICQAFNNDD